MRPVVAKRQRHRGTQLVGNVVAYNAPGEGRSRRTRFRASEVAAFAKATSHCFVARMLNMQWLFDAVRLPRSARPDTPSSSKLTVAGQLDISSAQQRLPARAFVALLAILTSQIGQAGPLPVEPPAPPWSAFAKVEGHANEIPVDWLATSEGRFAHNIRLPDSLRKTIPFDFAAARWIALKPKEPSVARQYFEHLCSTEAGSFILNPVDKVDGFFFMRPVGGATEQQNNDRWKLEAPGLQAGGWGDQYDPQLEAKRFVDAPYATYEWVDFPARDGGGVLHMSGHVSRASPMKVERRAESDARYALIWRGIRRERDREFAISGSEWIAFDRQTKAVLGVFRDFAITGFTINRPNGIYWLTSVKCPFRKEIFGRQDYLGDVSSWSQMVLRPSIYSKQLETIDQVKRGGLR